MSNLEKNIIPHGVRDADSVVQRKLKRAVSHIVCRHTAAMHSLELRCCVCCCHQMPLRRAHELTYCNATNTNSRQLIAKCIR